MISESQELGNLDVLRSLAVVFVVVSHLPFPFTKIFGAANYAVPALGRVGVLIFFVHTCFVLMLSLERQLLQYGERHLFGLFLLRRTLRIYPLSIVVVLSLFIYHYSSFMNPSHLKLLLSNLLLIQNLTGYTSIPAALWTLPFELQMYIFLPILYLLVYRLKLFSPFLLIGLWFLSVFLAISLWRLNFPFSYSIYRLIRFFPCFLSGVLAFSLNNRFKIRSPIFLFFYVFTMALFFPYAVAHGVKENPISWPACLILGAMISLCVEIQKGWVTQLGKIVARYSYGIYLVHTPCINFCFRYWNGNPFLQWNACLLGICLFSFAAYHIIEKPGIKFASNLMRQWAN